MLAGLHRGEVPRTVQPVRERVVDRLDLGIGDHVRVRVEYPLDAVLLRVLVGPLAVPRGNRDQAGTGVLRRGDDGAPGDAGRSQDTQADRFSHAATFSRPRKLARPPYPLGMCRVRPCDWTRQHRLM